jgi:hypothetical protein
MDMVIEKQVLIAKQRAEFDLAEWLKDCQCPEIVSNIESNPAVHGSKISYDEYLDS